VIGGRKEGGREGGRVGAWERASKEGGRDILQEFGFCWRSARLGSTCQEFLPPTFSLLYCRLLRGESGII
jgi:hypothetical protein